MFFKIRKAKQMKYLIMILMPATIFSQTITCPDTLYTNDGKTVPCRILSINELYLAYSTSEEKSHKMELKNLTKIILLERGEIFNKEDGLFYKVSYLNKLLHRRNESAESEKSIRHDHIYRPGDHELLLMPTASTMNKGLSYLSSYELLLLNYNYAVTSRTHIGIFSLFPVTSDFLETFSFGFKQNYLRTDHVQSAFWGSYTIKNPFLSFGNVLSFYSGLQSYHIGIGGFRELEDSNDLELIYMLGTGFQVSQNSTIMLEYTNSGTAIEEDFSGLISIGVRFKGEKIAWDLAGMRPLESSGDLIFIPLVKATIVIGEPDI
jgi:hypothetical protein